PHLSRTRPHQSEHAFQERRLAHAVTPHQRDRLALADHEIDAVQDVAGPVVRVQAARLQQRLRVPSSIPHVFNPAIMMPYRHARPPTNHLKFDRAPPRPLARHRGSHPRKRGPCSASRRATSHASPRYASWTAGLARISSALPPASTAPLTITVR